MKNTNLRTPLARIEGLGAAHAGTAHFWRQRLTAAALIPLSIWFVASALAYVGAEQGAVATFFAVPVNAILMFLFIVAAVYHMSIGLQVVIEDYFHGEALKISLLVLVRGFCWAVGATAAFALFRMAFAGH
jgi:succinate dehydrogenase / fumarate reductase membrane anchor subunit